ncbi:hypothetical protein [Micromonospora sp. LOL_021]|uniref:hypothetical protein n=1 Tax=Micromonospora sp. LOL_021 TaxID=3345417 RepID=UPI003A83BBDC
MKRVGLGVLFFSWLYGVPFLLIVGMIRRMSSPYLATRAEAQAFGATTDTVLTTALVLNLALPAVGLLLAWLIRDRYWIRHFLGSLAGAVLIYFAVAVAGQAARTPLIGWTPVDNEPEPRVTRCIPTSGGRSCPGG